MVMGILSFLGAVAVLLVAAVYLNFVSQALEGRKTYFLHFGVVIPIVAIGAGLFPFWGWTSTAWVLGVAAVLQLVPPLWERLFSKTPPSGYLWHGDSPESDDN